MPLKLQGADNGNCRVYYRHERVLYCFQEDRPGQFRAYICSRDGEPSHETAIPEALDRLPVDDNATARAFRAWIIATNPIFWS